MNDLGFAQVDLDLCGHIQTHPQCSTSYIHFVKHVVVYETGGLTQLWFSLIP